MQTSLSRTGSLRMSDAQCKIRGKDLSTNKWPPTRIMGGSDAILAQSRGAGIPPQERERSVDECFTRLISESASAPDGAKRTETNAAMAK